MKKHEIWIYHFDLFSRDRLIFLLSGNSDHSLDIVVSSSYTVFIILLLYRWAWKSFTPQAFPCLDVLQVK